MSCARLFALAAIAGLLVSMTIMTSPGSVAAADGQWIEHAPGAMPPSGRMYFGQVYDPVRQRLIVIGGHPQFLNDVWALSLAGSRAWANLSPTGMRPTPRWGQTAVYDPSRDQVVVFGGTDGAVSNETWLLALSPTPHWSLAATSGPLPPGRRNHAAVYDPENDRMIIFGGDEGSTWLGDLWALSLDTMEWTELAPKGAKPSARNMISAVYDPDKERMLLYGGWNGTDYEGDLWALELKQRKPRWHRIHKLSSRKSSNEERRVSRRNSRRNPRFTSPGKRRDYTLAYDSNGKQLLLFGGSDGANLGDLWAFNLKRGKRWTKIDAMGTAPSPRFAGGAVFDPAQNQMIVFGGYDGNYRNDTHALSMSTLMWQGIGSGGQQPTNRREYVAALDAPNDRILYFGGASQAGDLNDVWSLSTSALVWTQLHDGSGVAPTQRHGAIGALDPVSGDLIVVGGYDTNYLNDVWRFDDASGWTLISPSGGPPSIRMYFSLVYDAARDHFVLFGGHPVNLNDTWILSLRPTPTWTQLAPTGTLPAPRHVHVAIMEPVSDRMIIFGGEGDGGIERNDVWSLSFATDPPHWTEISTSGTGPGPLRNLAVELDAARDRMLIYGGYDGANWRGELYALSLSSNAWTQLSPAGGPPGVRNLMSLVYDPPRDRFVLFGGWSGSIFRGDLWTLGAFTTAQDRSITVSQVANTRQLSLRVQNPARIGRLNLSLEFPTAANATVDLIDVGGRRILSRRIDGVRPGPRTFALDVRSRVSPGVYFVRVSQGAAATSTRVVLIQ